MFILLPYVEIRKILHSQKRKQNLGEKFKGLKTSQMRCINEVEQKRKRGVTAVTVWALMRAQALLTSLDKCSCPNMLHELVLAKQAHLTPLTCHRVYPCFHSGMGRRIIHSGIHF